MFDHLTRLFAAPETGAEDPEAATRLAAAAILVEAAMSDDVYAPEEQEAIGAILSRLYGLDAAAAAELRGSAEAATRQSLDQYRFTSVLKNATTVAERADFLTEVWRVVLTDGRRDPHEDAFMRKLAGLLYVPDKESGLARRRAMAP